jgi:hypothetical protein
MSLKAEASKGTIERFFSNKEGLAHLRVRARGNLLIIESTDSCGNLCPHARLKKQSAHKWFLEMPSRKGWESTFIEGTTIELMEWLIEKFPWSLAPQ